MIGTLAGVAVAVLGLAWLGQRALIYFPSDVVPSPAAAGVPDAETITVTTDDGLDLAAWYVPAAGEAVGAVLMLPGNAGNRGGRGPLAAALRDRGLATLLLDYRGFGGNPGRPSQDGLLADARAGAAALRRRSGLDASRTVYFGESLGTAVAAGLAAERPPAALILRSPFPSLADVGRLHYPWLPVGLLLRDEFPTGEWLADYDGPVLVVAGERDGVVPADLSRSVAAAAGPDIELVRIAGAGHNDRALLDGARLVDAVSAFLRDHAQLPVRAAGT
ncbi:MAG: alpha/beta hydrolase [Actinobacteria bacterium]|nr:alpha/beta hydrolase [Actinomycetota bacterium]